MGRVEKFFEKMGAFLVDRLRLDQSEKGNRELSQELASLRVTGSASLRDYLIRKVSLVLMVLTVGILLTVACLLFYQGEGTLVEGQRLSRPGYGEGDATEELTVQIGGKEVKEFEVKVQERKYTEKEKLEKLQSAMKALDTLLPGENQSLDEVREPLTLPETMEDGAVELSWTITPYGVIGEDGAILDVEQETGVLVEITGSLTCGEAEALYQASAKVFPPRLSQEEQLVRTIQKKVEEADWKESSQDTLTLPAEAEGEELIWQYPSENPAASLLALTLLTAVFVYLLMDSQVHRQAEERRNQLMLDYPDLMWKMTMLLGAGLSIKGTFTRISEQYLREQKASSIRGRTGGRKKKRVRYVYEEVRYACYEMQSGVPEAEAYERFGRRCQLPEYIRLGSVLSQNLKKGAKGLISLLEREASASLNDRKNHARKISEKAGTKLLLPMMLMLGIVLVVLMVPAFLSF